MKTKADLLGDIDFIFIMGIQERVAPLIPEVSIEDFNTKAGYRLYLKLIKQAYKLSQSGKVGIEVLELFKRYYLKGVEDKEKGSKLFSGLRTPDYIMKRSYPFELKMILRWLYRFGHVEASIDQDEFLNNVLRGIVDPSVF